MAEYVTVHNPRSGAVDVSNWEVEYSKEATALDYQTCAEDIWISSVTSNTKIVTIPAGTVLQAHGSITITVSGMLDDMQGAVRLLETATLNGTESSVVHDVVGWGSESLVPRCAEEAFTDIPKDNQLLTRCVHEGKMSDTNNNRDDFQVLSVAGYVIPNCRPEEPFVPEKKDCDTVVITEVLPSIEGSDTAKEFIELHNPTGLTIDLNGCGIALSGSSREYMFPADTLLPAKSYRAFYDNETGITLPNTSQTELLIVTATEEIAQLTYPATIKENHAWALIGTEWQQTNQPTPGAANAPSAVEVVKNQSQGLGACPVGKYRNPATNRCKSLVLAGSVLNPCKPGQTRNPETNRCRTMVTTVSSLTPCKPGQERNPETNRCRKADSRNSLKPCGTDEERNPETNRCRKVSATLASASAADKQTEEASSAANYAALGLIGASVAGYGAYEYRGDIRNRLIDMKARFFTTGKK